MAAHKERTKLKLVYNYTNGYTTTYPKNITNETIISNLKNYGVYSNGHIIHIYNVDHWEDKYLVDFNLLSPDEQDAVLKELTVEYSSN